MKTRTDIKNKHENADIRQFIEWFNSNTDSNFKVIKKPDPPDALISDGCETKWVEHCDLFELGKKQGHY